MCPPSPPHYWAIPREASGQSTIRIASEQYQRSTDSTGQYRTVQTVQTVQTIPHNGESKQGLKLQSCSTHLHVWVDGRNGANSTDNRDSTDGTDSTGSTGSTDSTDSTGSTGDQPGE